VSPGAQISAASAPSDRRAARGAQAVDLCMLLFASFFIYCRSCTGSPITPPERAPLHGCYAPLSILRCDVAAASDDC